MTARREARRRRVLRGFAQRSWEDPQECSSDAKELSQAGGALWQRTSAKFIPDRPICQPGKASNSGVISAFVLVRTRIRIGRSRELASQRPNAVRHGRWHQLEPYGSFLHDAAERYLDVRQAAATSTPFANPLPRSGGVLAALR